MKTKEQLRDIKLFADFIDVRLIKEMEDCIDTKTSVHTDWLVEINIDLLLGRFIYKSFNPQEDWNLLHKAYEKINELDKQVEFKSRLEIQFLELIAKAIRNSIVNSNKKDVYNCVLQFIKESIKNNTNNNQS